MSTRLLNPFSSDLRAKQRAEQVPPEPHRPMADLNAALVQQIFDILERQRVPDIHHHRQADDFRGRLKVAKRGAFCHPAKLGVRPARLNQFSSGSAVGRATGAGV